MAGSEVTLFDHLLPEVFAIISQNAPYELLSGSCKVNYAMSWSNRISAMARRY